MNNKTVKQASRFFTTGIGLITSFGPYGQNVMAAEWTMQISYDPMLIAVFIHNDACTLSNIKKTKRFGVNIASEKQSALVSVSGGYSRKELDKLKIQGLFKIGKFTQTQLPSIINCTINAECELFTIKKLGDHNMVVGKVLSMKYDQTKKPLIYHRNRYFKLGESIEPIRDKVSVNEKTFEVFSKKGQNNFIVKIVGVLVKSNGKLLVFSHLKGSPFYTIPFVVSAKGKDNRKELESFIERMKLGILLVGNPKIKRLAIYGKSRIQRINFVLFDGRTIKNQNEYLWKKIKQDPILKSLVR